MGGTTENRFLRILDRMFGLDLRALALYRVLLALLILCDLVVRVTDLEAHYTDFGVLPRDVLISKWWYGGYTSIHLMSGVWQGQLLIFLLHGLVTFCLLIGYRTRLAAFLSWLFVISLHNRNPMVLQGGDLLLRAQLFWGMFLPLGARYSVDEALSPERVPSNRFLSVGSAALLLQVAIMYWFTAVLKTGKEWSVEGSAVYYALHIEQFAKPFGMWVRQFPTALRLFTRATWWLEMVGPFLLFVPVAYVPLRLLAIAAFVGLHFGLYHSMELGIFPFISSVCMIPFLPSEALDWVVARVRRRWPGRLNIYYDAECGFCRKTVLLLQEFLLLGPSPVATAQENGAIFAAMKRENSWVVVDDLGNRYFRWAGVTQAVRHSALFGFLGPLLEWGFIGKLGDRIYRLIAKRRGLLGKATAVLLPYRQPSAAGSWVSNVVALNLLLFVFAWNCVGVPQWKIEMPSSWTWIAEVTRLDQRWDMFAPYPLREDGWYVMPGRLEGGAEVDVYRRLNESVSWEKPARVARLYPNDRWRSYMMMIWNRDYESYREYFGEYTCAFWNREAAVGSRLARFDIFFVKNEVQPGYQPPKSERVLLWQHECFEPEPN